MTLYCVPENILTSPREGFLSSLNRTLLHTGQNAATELQETCEFCAQNYVPVQALSINDTVEPPLGPEKSVCLEEVSAYCIGCDC